MHLSLFTISPAFHHRAAIYRSTGWGAFVVVCLALWLLNLTAQAQNGPDCDRFVNKTSADGLGSDAVYGVYAVAGAPGNTTVYAATDGGLGISTNGGLTFTNKTTANGLGSNRVFAVYAVGTTVYAATDGGLSISTDGGQTFTNKTTADGLGSNGVRAVYAVGTTVYAATDGGLSISTNRGQTFTNKTTADGLGSNDVFGVYAVGTTVYAATFRGGLSISTDGGQTFTNKTTANGLGSNDVVGVYAVGTTVYAATSAGLFMPNGGLSISTDGGQTFTNRTTADGLGGNSVRAVYAVGNTVYAATDTTPSDSGGLSISTDGGQTFTNRTAGNGLGANSMSGVYVIADQIYVATFGGLSFCDEGLKLTASATPAAVCLGSPARLSVDVSGGTGPYSYTWVAPVGVQLSAINTQMISATPTATGVQTLTVLVADSSSPTHSASATVDLTVNARPVITIQPVGTTKCAGENYTFAVTASNAGGYQWQKDGVDIAGATLANLVLNSLSTSSAGTYRVRVIGAATCNGQSLISNQAVLVINTPQSTPIIAVLPTSSVFTGGNPKVIYLGYGPQSVRLQASGGQTYQWAPASNLSNASIADPVFTPTQAGKYPFTVTASNGCQTTASASVTITVIDVRSGKKDNKVVICHKGKELSVDASSVGDHLGHGDQLGACGSSSANGRRGVEEQTELEVQVLGNPLSGEQVEALISGAAGQALRVELVNLQGLVMDQQQFEQAEPQQRVVLQVGSIPGLYLLRVSTGAQQKTLKVINP